MVYINNDLINSCEILVNAKITPHTFTNCYILDNLTFENYSNIVKNFKNYITNLSLGYTTSNKKDYLLLDTKLESVAFLQNFMVQELLNDQKILMKDLNPFNNEYDYKFFKINNFNDKNIKKHLNKLLIRYKRVNKIKNFLGTM